MASALRGSAGDALLIADFVGSEGFDPSGETVGTLTDLTVVPGDAVVAALVEPKDGGEPLAIPCKAVKLSRTAGTAGVAPPRPLGELRDSKAVKSLSQALGGVAAGGG